MRLSRDSILYLIITVFLAGMTLATAWLEVRG